MTELGILSVIFFAITTLNFFFQSKNGFSTDDLFFLFYFILSKNLNEKKKGIS